MMGWIVAMVLYVSGIGAYVVNKRLAEIQKLKSRRHWPKALQNALPAIPLTPLRMLAFDAALVWPVHGLMAFVLLVGRGCLSAWRMASGGRP